jgi:ornithine cyclodeaminase
MKIYTLEEIKKTIEPGGLVKSQEEAFVAYSDGRVVVPPVGYLHFEDASGDCHIKYGYVKGDDYFVVKIATGFYQNPEIGLPVGDGMMSLFSQRTGSLEALLLDEGYLTDMRTAAAGAVAAKYLAPKKIDRIGIVGTGLQARLQLEMLKNVTDCRAVVVWGRDQAKKEQYKLEMTASGFSVVGVARIEDLVESCNLIVTTTSARKPLIHAPGIRPGTHITAVGADAPGKQELDPNIFKKAQVRVVDSLSQCVEHGDTAHAVKAGLIEERELFELGEVIKYPELRRTDEKQITVADLTGVAVQDIQIAKLAYLGLHNPQNLRVIEGENKSGSRVGL